MAFITGLCKNADTSAKFDGAKPSIVFSDEYNFFTYELSPYFSPAMSDVGLAAWAVPKAEYVNPLEWAVLAHEVAHTVFDERELCKEVASQMRRETPPDKLKIRDDWIVELNADLFALRCAGPAYLFSLIYFAVFFIEGRLEVPMFPPSALRGGFRKMPMPHLRVSGEPRFYPPPALRVRLLAEEIATFSVSKGDALSAYEEAKMGFMDLFSARKLFDVASRNHEQYLEYALEEDLAREVWESIKHVQAQRFPNMHSRREDELRSATALAQRFESRILGASLPKGNRDQISRFIRGGDALPGAGGAKGGTGREETLREVKKPLSDLDERPATMFEVLNGGWIYNGNLLARALTTVDDGLVRDATQSRHALERFCEELLEPSFQIQQSLRIALVLSSIRERLESTNGETERR
jgi:hypothetical protein